MSQETNNISDSVRNSVRFASLKTEKLVTALYMVTDMLPQEEPLKWNIREAGLHLLKDISGTSLDLSGNRNRPSAVLNKISSGIVPLISFLQVARFSGNVSEMNISLLQKEFEGLLKFIGDAKSSEDLNFSTQLTTNLITEPTPKEEPAQTNKVGESSITNDNKAAFNKGQTTPGGESSMSFINQPKIKNSAEESNIEVDTEHNQIAVTQKTAQVEEVKREQVSTRTTPAASRNGGEEMGRKESILGLVKAGDEYTIKDIAIQIPGVSEKTIQRDLQALVSAGLLRKRGERRWCRYFRA